MEVTLCLEGPDLSLLGVRDFGCGFWGDGPRVSLEQGGSLDFMY